MKASVTLHAISHYSNLLEKDTVEYRKVVVSFHKLGDRIKNESEQFRANIPDVGKALYALRVRYQSLQATTPVPPEVAGRTFPEYAKSFLGIDGRLNNHAESVSNACRLIAAEKITEADFDLVCSGGKYEAMSRASRIMTSANDDFTHPAVVEACELLKTRPADLLKKLKAILDRFVEVEDEATKGTTKVYLSDEEIAERGSTDKMLAVTTALDEMAKDGNLTPLFTAIEAAARTTEANDVAREIVHGVCRIRTGLAENTVEKDGAKTRRFTVETLNGWAAEVMPPVMETEDSLKVEYLTAANRMAEIDAKFESLGKSNELDELLGNETPNAVDAEGHVVPKS